MNENAPELDSIDEAMAYEEAKKGEKTLWQKTKNFGVKVSIGGGLAVVVAGVPYAAYKGYKYVVS